MNTSVPSRGRALVCDDSLLMRKLVIDSLTDDGWTIVGEAQNGQEAVDMYKELSPDVVTMDIVMPEHDGVYGLSQIIAYDPDAKVVVVSALNQTTLVAEAVRKGAQDFIVKPFLPEHLQETMRRLVDANLPA
ncbi:response regulator [Blastopirellula marina]|uniref:Two-component system response regulator n=1 Tax=Blastopirellula marina TaxID=124 RepID=A0A2S8G1Z5_9BACT|nr:response regulator [Blastopirellula marina]PQO38467.1 two-component system response regulator [Blastopirellula marina]PTL45124.1 response regulator [Blastopirellula marina]